MTDIPGHAPPEVINYLGTVFTVQVGIPFLVGLLIAYPALRNIEKSVLFSFLGAIIFSFTLSEPVYLLLINVFGLNYHFFPDFNSSFIISRIIFGIASGIVGILLASGYTKVIQYLESKGKWTEKSQMIVRKFIIAGSLSVAVATLIFLISTVWLSYVSWRFYNIPVLRYYFYPSTLIGIVVISGVLVIAVYILKIEFKKMRLG